MGHTCKVLAKGVGRPACRGRRVLDGVWRVLVSGRTMQRSRNASLGLLEHCASEDQLLQSHGLDVDW